MDRPIQHTELWFPVKQKAEGERARHPDTSAGIHPPTPMQTGEMLASSSERIVRATRRQRRPGRQRAARPPVCPADC
jgi:hypothetical protein